MTVLAENDLQITLPAGSTGRKFDDEASHGLSHCMKAVDFIVELDDRVLFIELKDPEHPAAQPKDQKKFLQKFLSGALDADLKTKYRDSFLYEWASGQAMKPIYYLVLIGASTLSDADLLARTDALKRQIPTTGPDDKPWKRSFVAGCAVMNIDAWNKALPHYPVSRVSA
ncbi:hypothetical protein ABZN20_13180 [Methylococcus sp. ANG]|uniref:hypothetical protein n=1 Tax=unclassified Methylococcus TaxID=2618889 RepID=UPI001C533677|nr:hypothetical protein [Methylococcus sp. Mc7]QXP85333.1 hypothetical protein KW115_06310 [Methylococcus sp. Mc7]